MGWNAAAVDPMFASKRNGKKLGTNILYAYNVSN